MVSTWIVSTTGGGPGLSRRHPPLALERGRPSSGSGASFLEKGLLVPAGARAGSSFPSIHEVFHVRSLVVFLRRRGDASASQHLEPPPKGILVLFPF